MKVEQAVLFAIVATAGCTEVVTATPQSPPVAASTCEGVTPVPDELANTLVADQDPVATSGGPLNGPVYIACRPPPPLSGGTLAITSGQRAVVSDPDHDQIVVVDLDEPRVTHVIPLQLGDQPGRIAEGALGQVHVVLRSGFVLSFDPVSGSVFDRRAVCSEPRGIAFDATKGLFHVACAGGELVSFPDGGPAIRRVVLDSDLRDVVVEGDRLLVSRFRSAELLVVEADGTVSRRVSPPTLTETQVGVEPPVIMGPGSPGIMGPASPTTFTPAVAWRTFAAPGGGVLMVFQEDQTSEVKPQPGGYGGLCGGIVRPSLALLHADGTSSAYFSLGAALPLDAAITPSGELDIISGAAHQFPQGSVVTVSPNSFVTTATMTTPTCSPGLLKSDDGSSTDVTAPIPDPDGQVVAIAYDARGRRLVQTREPYTLVIQDRALVLPGDSRRDTGQDLFHMATSSGLACASCHPEGREDGHVWTFADLGSRRTQSISGGLLGTEPFHWGGDMTTFGKLAHDVMGGRMVGPLLSTPQLRSLASWIDRIPAPNGLPDVDEGEVARGGELFANPAVGCATCHAGEKLTNNKTVDVGTGGLFQVPSLVGVGWRAPYLHNGCAPTLEARFGDCGGGDKHGHTSGLSDQNRADLVAYLKSL